MRTPVVGASFVRFEAGLVFPQQRELIETDYSEPYPHLTRGCCASFKVLRTYPTIGLSTPSEEVPYVKLQLSRGRAEQSRVQEGRRVSEEVNSPPPSNCHHHSGL